MSKRMKKKFNQMMGLFINYLIDRGQIIKYEFKLSPFNCTSGEPQGSHLGPCDND